MASGYWQLPLDVYQFNVLPFGLNCAPAVFQRTIRDLFRDIQGIMIYLDDILVMGKSVEETLQRLKQVFEICKKRTVTLKYKKCKFLMSDLNYLGYVISASGYKVDRRRVEELKQLPNPKNKDEVLRTLGLFGYYRIFIRNFAETSSPLAELLKKTVKFDWTAEHTRCSEELMKKLIEHTINSFFYPHKKAVLDTSKTAIGEPYSNKRRVASSCQSYSFRGIYQTWNKTGQRDRSLCSGLIHATIEKLSVGTEI